MSITFEEVPLGKIKPDPEQPRKTIDEDELAALVESVKLHGILTPLRLRRNGGEAYIIVAGERRYRAAQAAKLEAVPATIVDADTHGIEALVENLQRQDLNAIEEGDAYRKLTEAAYTVDAIARGVARPKERIVDRIGLASLPEAARRAVIDGRLLLADARDFVPLAAEAPEFAAALCSFADQAAGWGRDPWRLFFEMDRHDPSVVVTTCKECDGDGYLHDDGEAEEECAACAGSGELRERSGEGGYPPFFAFALWRETPLADTMLAQLPEPVQERVRAARQRAQDYYDAARKKAGYVPQVPTLGLTSDTVIDVAVAGQFAVSFGEGRYVVIDPAFVAEYLPDHYDAVVDEYVSGSRRSGATGAAKGKRELTPEQEQEREQRARERAKAAKQRADAREFNSRLAVAIQTKLGEVPVTTEAVKLLVQTIVDQTKREAAYQPGRLGGDGHSMFHRYTANDWPTTKAGDYKIARSAADRSEFAVKVYRQTEKELAAAKTPEQALGVLVRFLAHGLADLRGLPKGDLDGLYPFRTQRQAWRKFVLARLPKAIRDKAPAENGRKGSSQAW